MHTKLLKSQKNDAFQIVQAQGLDPVDFEWSQIETRWPGQSNSEPVELLTHKPSGFYFAFDRYGTSPNPRCFPSHEKLEEVDCGTLSNWKEVTDTFATWVSIVQKEHDEPDYWELSKNDSRLVATKIDDLDNIQFSHEEQQRLSTSINEIKEYLLTSFEQTADQQRFIETRLQHLEEASGRLGRKDWITLAMGTLTNIVVGTALAPHAARELLRTAGSLLGWVVGTTHLIP